MYPIQIRVFAVVTLGERVRCYALDQILAQLTSTQSRDFTALCASGLLSAFQLFDCNYSHYVSGSRLTSRGESLPDHKSLDGDRW